MAFADCCHFTASITSPPRMVTCELSRVGCCLRRCQQQISTCKAQEGGESLSRAENDPRRLSQKVCGKVVLKVRPIAGERRQHHRHCSYNRRTPRRMTECQSHPPPPGSVKSWIAMCCCVFSICCNVISCKLLLFKGRWKKVSGFRTHSVSSPLFWGPGDSTCYVAIYVCTALGTLR